MSTPALSDREHHTYGEYLQWSDDVRYELIDGVAYLKETPSLDHQEIVGGIYYQLANSLQAKSCRVFISPLDVRFPKTGEVDEQVDTVLQPDVLVVCDPAKLDRRGVRGAPDLVVEVLSPGTSSHDHVRKRRVYERAGVAEYWLVHPIDRMVTVYRLAGGEYGKPDGFDLSGETPVGVLPDVVIQWDALVERLTPVED